MISFELLEKPHFQETFYWIDMCNISKDKNVSLVYHI